MMTTETKRIPILERKLCAVHGYLGNRGLCAKIIVGMKHCGFSGDCEHQRDPLPTHDGDEGKQEDVP
jgi:hypothetical protein